MKKKIFFLTEKLCNETGGAIYDNYFYNKLTKRYKNKVKSIEDSDFISESKKQSLINFSKIYFRNFKELSNCDILILNSRLYTRFIISMIFSKFKAKTCKIIMIHHHYNYMTHKGILKYIHKVFEINFLKIADEIIIPNPYIKDLTERKKIITGKKIELKSSFKEANFQISTGKNKKILFVGNIDKRKGIIYAIKAFEKFVKNNPEYIFNIVGKYDENDKYIKKLKKYLDEKKLNDSVKFIGRVDEKELGKYYSTSDIFLFPSLNEGFGWVMMEAMAHGLPVVAFDNTAMPYTVKNGINGFLVTNLNIDELSKSLQKISSDRKLFEKLRNGAIDTYKNANKISDLDRDIEKYLEKLV